MHLRRYPAATARFQMAEDQRRFNHYEQSSFGRAAHSAAEPFMRYYVWQQPSITLGYRQAALQPYYVSEKGFRPEQVAVRPTGGGIVEHQPGELTYALFLPVHLLPVENMETLFKRLSQPLLSALTDFGVNAYLQSHAHDEEQGHTDLYALCFSGSQGYEIGVEGKKVLGQAQRMGRRVFLAQGTFQNLGITPENYDAFVRAWEKKIEEALRAWGANPRASALCMPSQARV